MTEPAKNNQKCFGVHYSVIYKKYLLFFAIYDLIDMEKKDIKMIDIVTTNGYNAL